MAKATKRVYLAEIGDAVRLVRATHPSPVVSHVSRDMVKVRIPTQDELIKAVEAGVKVEDIDAHPDQMPLGG